VPDVGLHGIFRHEHRRGDLPVRQPLCDQGGDAAFGFGKPPSRDLHGDEGEFPAGLGRPQRRAQVFEDGEGLAE
jgi:hypothetical protein